MGSDGAMECGVVMVLWGVWGGDGAMGVWDSDGALGW